MIKVAVIKGVQTITEICDTCKCHIQDLTVNDILVKRKTPLKVGFDQKVTITNSDDNEVTRTEPRPKCYCESCCD